MGTTKIEWADVVWNPVTGCTKISPGCKNCYAERMSKRLAGRFEYPKDDPFKVTIHKDERILNKPYMWKKPRRIFVGSMTDIFHEDLVDNLHKHEVSSFYENLFYLIYWSPIHVFIFLTKRPENMKKVFDWFSGKPFNQTAVDEFDGYWRDKLPLKNIWLGVTAENQKAADTRIPILLDIPSSKRFLSIEPMLGPVDLRSERLQECNRFWDQNNYIDWVICGGESGSGARPMHPAWVRSLRDQCIAADVPFFFKGWGEWEEWKDKPEGQIICNLKTKNILKFSQSTKDVFPPAVIYSYETVMQKVGKKAAGKLLDGRTWDQMPHYAQKRLA